MLLLTATRRDDQVRYPSPHRPKAARVLAALKRDGWTETRRRGSHRVLVKDDRQRIWAYHEGVDLGGRRWLGSPKTTVIPLLSCASYRTMII
ncbi:MAG: type II toxin-antitoxin system HicA family toxin [Pseudonocardiaceae bacterium]